MFGFFKKRVLIDNSDIACEKRVNYLRMKSPLTHGAFSPELEEEVGGLPRTISWKLRGYAYGAFYSPFDLKHYHHKEELLAEAREITDSKIWKKSDGSPQDYESVLKSLISSRICCERMFHGIGCIFELGFENKVVDFDVRELDENGNLPLPAELSVLGVSSDDWEHWKLDCLQNYYWEGAGHTHIKEHSICNGESKCELRVEPAIRVEINGIKGYAFSLTVTEKQRIIESIANGLSEGSFISDGKEYISYVRKGMDDNGYGWSDEAIAESVNSLHIYGVRSSYSRGYEYYKERGIL